MNYIKGRVTIFDQLENIVSRGYCYYGAVEPDLLENPHQNLSLILRELEQMAVPAGEFVVCPITSAVYDETGEIQEFGRNCVFIYPQACKKLKAIYVQQDGEYIPINLISAWERVDVTVLGVPCYLYYQELTTKDIDLYYQFVFEDGKPSQGA